MKSFEEIEDQRDQDGDDEERKTGTHPFVPMMEGCMISESSVQVTPKLPGPEAKASAGRNSGHSKLLLQVGGGRDPMISHRLTWCTENESSNHEQGSQHLGCCSTIIFPSYPWY